MARALVIKHVACEGPGLLKNALEKCGLECNIHEIWKNPCLPDPGEFSLVVVMGGPMNVYETDKYPFLAAENEFLQTTLKKNTPILGVCLGGQLLAKALGARVSRSKDTEIGHFTINLTNAGRNDPVFSGFPNVFPVFQWHGDTFEIPKVAHRLALSSLCENQAFRAGESYGLQFHIEVTPEMVSEWCREYSRELQAAGADPRNLIEESRQKKGLYAKQAENFVSNLLIELDIA